MPRSFSSVPDTVCFQRERARVVLHSGGLRIIRLDLTPSMEASLKDEQC